MATEKKEIKPERKSISTEGDKVTRVSHTDKKGKETTVTIEEISNGFLIVKEIYNPSGKDGERWKIVKTYVKERPQYDLGELNLEDFII